MKLLRAADRLLVAALDALIVALAGLLLVLMNYAVFSRFVLNASVSWGEELPAHLLATLTFIGAAYLTRTNEHLGFDNLLVSLPLPVQRVLMIAILLLMTAFALCLAYYGAIATWSFAGRELVSISLPVYLFRGAMPLGGAIIALICVARIIGLASGRLSPRDIQAQGHG